MGRRIQKGAYKGKSVKRLAAKVLDESYLPMETAPRCKKRGPDRETDCAQTPPEKLCRLQSSSDAFPELPLDAIVTILEWWFKLNHRTPGFLTEFVRMFRVCKIALLELDRECYWRPLVDHIGSGWYHKVHEKERALPAGSGRFSDSLLIALYSYDIIPLCLHHGAEELEAVHRAFCTVDTTEARYLAAFDHLIVHKNEPFQDPKTWMIKIGDVSLSKRKICAVLLAFKKPIYLHDAVRFLLCMQGIPLFPEKAFRWIVQQNLTTSLAVKTIIDEKITDGIRVFIRGSQRTISYDHLTNTLGAWVKEIRRESDMLSSLLLLVKIFDREDQPWSEANRTLTQQQQQQSEREQPGDPSVATESNGRSPDREFAAIDHPPKEEEAIKEACDVADVGALIASSQKNYSFALRGRIAHEMLSFYGLVRIPQTRMRALYLGKALHARYKSPQAQSTIRLVFDQMGPNSLGVGSTRLTVDAAQKIFLQAEPEDTRALLSQYSNDHCLAGMYIFFAKYLVVNDPFILWTLAKLSRVCTSFHHVFGQEFAATWAVLLRLMFEKPPDETLEKPNRNEISMARQLGIDISTFRFVKDDESGSHAEHRAMVADKQRNYGIGASIMDSYPTIVDAMNDEWRHYRQSIGFRRCLVLRFSAFYSLPRDRIFSVYQTLYFPPAFCTDRPWTGYYQRYITSTAIRYLVFLIENSVPCALPPFSHIGSFKDYTDKLMRSRADRNLEILKLKCQMVMNNGLIAVLESITSTDWLPFSSL
jgi:hypothetical protein